MRRVYALLGSYMRATALWLMQRSTGIVVLAFIVLISPLANNTLDTKRRLLKSRTRKPQNTCNLLLNGSVCSGTNPLE